MTHGHANLHHPLEPLLFPCKNIENILPIFSYTHAGELSLSTDTATWFGIIAVFVRGRTADLSKLPAESLEIESLFLHSESLGVSVVCFMSLPSSLGHPSLQKDHWSSLEVFWKVTQVSPKKVDHLPLQEAGP